MDIFVTNSAIIVHKIWVIGQKRQHFARLGNDQNLGAENDFKQNGTNDDMLSNSRGETVNAAFSSSSLKREQKLPHSPPLLAATVV